MKCCIKKCKNNHKNRLKGISFHRFPSSDARKALWTDSLGVCNIKQTKKLIICSVHFTPSDFLQVGNKRFLTETAVPKINKNQSLQNRIQNIDEYNENANGPQVVYLARNNAEFSEIKKLQENTDKWKKLLHTEKRKH